MVWTWEVKKLGGAWVLPVLWAQKRFEATLGVTAIVAAVRHDVRFLVAPAS